MKIKSKILMVLVSAMFIASCATAGKIQIPEKYALGNQLEEVQSIWRTRIMGWEDVDNQSLIIQTTPSEYYLIILSIPSSELPFRSNRIGITHSLSMIRAGLDSVIVSNSAHLRNSYPIDRIYKLDGTEQMRSIRDQLIDGKGNEAGNTETPKLLNDKTTEI